MVELQILSNMVYIKRFSLLLILLQIACDQPDAWNCTKVRGETVVQQRSLSGFRGIEIFDHLEVVLIQSDQNSVEIETGKNLINDITTIVKDSMLSIRDLNKCGILRDKREVAKVNVYFDKIEYLESRSSYRVYSLDTLRFDDELLISKRSNGTLDLTVNASHVAVYSNEYGDTNIKGNSTTASVLHQGNGQVDLSQLYTSVSGIYLQGSGTCLVNCVDKLVGDIIRNSKAVVYGSPSNIDVKILDQASIEYRP
jgi:hypothetical protein